MAAHAGFAVDQQLLLVAGRTIEAHAGAEEVVGHVEAVWVLRDGYVDGPGDEARLLALVCLADVCWFAEFARQRAVTVGNLAEKNTGRQ